MGRYIWLPHKKHKTDVKFISLASGGDWKAMYAEHDFSGWYYASVAAWALAKVTYKDVGITNQEILGIVPVDEIGGEKSIAEFNDYFIGYCVEPPLNDDEEMAKRIDVVRELIEEDKLEESKK